MLREIFLWLKGISSTSTIKIFLIYVEDVTERGFRAIESTAKKTIFTSKNLVGEVGVSCSRGNL